ncbi:Cytochrome c [Gemmata obscuriglobus]|uniref:Heme-binding protein n=1 Tax=Gemmata obscuriglobus TaxID=114 RepID=A0A2Z3H1C5_9BACT|nr:c-type cytochrome [Gemmata obscuriglobus]AWM38651.1 heme-binding protein [Gemmata obscuriglobus]QEG28390.1 Cytochrome c [Gemmata obscuriglobus]VTS06317.1 heme-binding protein : Putative heme-binding domain-containing protein OS=Singulisphaera acidiphila (strain ATCC BAA-1392 / DSM 18658 / VKM B-2454 / MOB10) GN=Sinac_4636 PE=4 SV=1: Cytochrom_C [Gemmata obscuriglobus UQM 2246]
MFRSRLRASALALSAALFALSPVSAPAQPKPKAKAVEPPATDPATMKVAKGFKVELLYSVPKDTMGSWVSMCVDPKGRLIVSDQYGALYRVSVPPAGAKGETAIEKIPAAVGSAQGLLYAFDALYVVVNAPNKSGLYKVTSSKKDDTLDTVELLRAFEGGGGEHGPHAVMLTPDGKRLTVVCGNQTKLTKYDTTKVPPYWGEDHLLPRLPDGNGFMKGVMGPGGAIYNVTPDGKQWELFSVGFRNQYDAAYNRAGDLFTYDADMEWDFNTPWYRPTRVCFVPPGGEFGWRNGAGKYPEYYPDNLPPVLNVGPGSPTGVCFGYGAKFPAKYQNAFFICDWSYGKLYAVHLKPKSYAYTGELEEFVTGTPLPLTDLVVNPTDGALYFAIGGRKTKSGLYRVTYTGTESTEAVAGGESLSADEQAARRRYKTLVDSAEHSNPAFKDVMATAADSRDRFALAAARRVLESQPVDQWRELALAATDATEAAHALLGLVRVSAPCPEHTPDKKVKGDPALRAKVLAALGRFDLAKLTDQQKLDLLRVYQVLFNRFGSPTADERKAVLAKLSPVLPSGNRFVNGMVLEVLVYLQDDTVAPRAVKALKDAPTQEEQIEYARSLRMLKAGWTPELRKDYFEWFVKAAGYKGGNSFGKFLKLIRDDAVLTLAPAEKVALGALLTADPAAVKLPPEPARPLVKAYKVADLTDALEKGLKSGRDYERGRKLFATGKCFGCHRFDGEGGSNAPDLTGVAGRFSPRDLLESIIDPSKEISDQYGAVEIRTADDRVIKGRIVNLNNDNVMVNTNMLEPGSTVSVNRKLIESMTPSKVSMMPTGLVDTFQEDEVLDLLAYILSRGDRNSAVFKK